VDTSFHLFFQVLAGSFADLFDQGAFFTQHDALVIGPGDINNL
jgi:hypothetical protein